MEFFKIKSKKINNPDGSDLTLIRFNGSSHIHPNRIENTEEEALQYATKYCNIHNITPTEDNLR